MNLFNQLFFALLSTNLLPGILAVPQHRPELTKRAPPDIENWDLYKFWDYQTTNSPYYCDQSTDNVPVGTYDRTAKKLTWSTGDCEEKVAQWSSTIATGEVSIYKGTLTTGDGQSTDVAVKRGGEDSVTGILYGASLQKQFDHPNILPALDYVVQEGNSWAHLIMPYIEAKSLEQNLASYSSQGAVNTAFKQILSALAALQDKNVIHRDIKPENFLVDSDGTLKLIDFDTAIQGESSDSFNVGTRTYVAPETLAIKGPFTNKVDTFAMGMTFLVMSVTDLQNDDNRFELWKDLIVPNGQQWPSAETIANVLTSKNYAVFSGNDKLLNVIAKSLCEPGTRYDPKGFQSAFGGVA